MGYRREQIAQLGVRPRVRNGNGLLPCEKKEVKAVVRAILNDKDSDELWQFWRLIPFEDGYACQQRKLFEEWVANEVENMWYDIGIPVFDKDGSWSCPEGGWWPYLKTEYLDISWLKVGNAIIDMDEIWTTLRNYLQEKVQGYRMSPGMMLYRVVREWIVTRVGYDNLKSKSLKGDKTALSVIGTVGETLTELEKQMIDLVRLYPTETTKNVEDHVWLDSTEPKELWISKQRYERERKAT